MRFAQPSLIVVVSIKFTRSLYRVFAMCTTVPSLITAALNVSFDWDRCYCTNNRADCFGDGKDGRVEVEDGEERWRV
jgi:hypothetical protein